VRGTNIRKTKSLGAIVSSLERKKADAIARESQRLGDATSWGAFSKKTMEDERGLCHSATEKRGEGTQVQRGVVSELTIWYRTNPFADLSTWT